MKNKTFVLKGLFAVALLIMMTACGQKTPAAEEVAARIQAKQTLTEADYNSMVDYCADYAKEAQKYYDVLNSQPASSAEYGKALSDMATLTGKYTYFGIFSNEIFNYEFSKLSEQAQKKVNEYAQYQAMPLPIGTPSDANKNVVGDIEQMPSDSNSPVIATGDGEVVD